MTNLSDIIISMHNYYFSWGGRVWWEFYQQLFTLLGKTIFNFCNTIIYIVNTLLAFCMLAAPTSPERTWFCVVVFIVIAVGILYEKFDFENINVNEKTILMLRRLVLTVIIFATCNFIVMYLDTVMSTYEIRTQTKQREEYILSEKAKGNLDISTSMISHKYPFLSHHDALYGLTDITEDPNHYANKAVCRYYGIRSIVGILAKDKQYLNN